MLVVTAPMTLTYPAVKAGLAFAPPLRFAGMCALLGGLALWVALLLRREPLWPEARLARWILPFGMLSTALTLGMMFSSPAHTGAGIASVLGNTQPLILIILAALFLGESIGRCKVLSLLLGLTGVILLALPALRGHTGHPFFGAMLALGSACSAAVASVMVKRLKPGGKIMSFTAGQLFAGSIVLFGLSAMLESRQKIVWTAGFVGPWLFLGLAGGALSIWLWFWLLQRAEAGDVSLFIFLVPVFGLFIAMVAFGERLEFVQTGGVLLIPAALAVSLIAEWRCHAGLKPVTSALKARMPPQIRSN